MTELTAVFEQAGAAAPGSGTSEPTPANHVFRAQQIGLRVPRRPAHGVVHSVFRSACNIELDRGTLITLLASSVGSLPHGVRCASAISWNLESGLRPGQAVVATAQTLDIPRASVVVDLTRAAPWSGRLTLCKIDARSTRALTALRALIVADAQDGFAPILLRRSTADSPLLQAMAQRLDSCLPRLAAATATLDATAAAQALLPLIGLGPGLTPSGDDFIVGYLAAMWSRCQCEPRFGAFRSRLAPELERLTTRTNAIGRQFILDAVDGEFSERLVDVVRSIAHRDSDVNACVARALRTGHSSGADCLVGLLFGFALRVDSVARVERADAL
jgi:hypothetical protein